MTNNRTARLATLVILAVMAFNAEAEADFAIDTHLTYGYSADAGTSMQESIEIEPRLGLNPGARWRIELSARLRLDSADKLEPGRALTGTYSSISRPAAIDQLGTLELRNAYLEYALANGVLRLGKQQIVWGRLDGIKVLDVLNPQDFHEFILQDLGRSRIGLWSAYLDLYHGSWRAELAVIPDNTGHAIPTQGAWYELSAPRFRYGAPAGDATPVMRTSRGSAGVHTGAVGLRLSRQFGAFDASAMAYSGLDHEPLGRIIDQGAGRVLERYYERRALYGLSMETAFGAAVIRAELAVQPGRTFNLRTPDSLDTGTLDQASVGVGIDVDGPFSTFINFQHVYDRVRDAPPSLVRPDKDRVSTVFIRRSFAYDSIEVTARWYFSHGLRDQMFSLGVDYEIADNTRLSLSANSFSGNSDGVFGQFSARDRLTLALAFTF